MNKKKGGEEEKCKNVAVELKKKTWRDEEILKKFAGSPQWN